MSATRGGDYGNRGNAAWLAISDQPRKMTPFHPPFAARVIDAKAMLRSNRTAEEVREKHGGIVLRAAFQAMRPEGRIA